MWATVGSTNLDWRSFLHNHELNAVVLGAEFGAQVQALFERDQSESDLVTLERWHQRGLTLRLQEAFACTWDTGCERTAISFLTSLTPSTLRAMERAGLACRSCECHAVIKAEYDRLLSSGLT